MIMERVSRVISRSRFLLLFLLSLTLVFTIAPVAYAGYFDGGYKAVSNNGAAATIETQYPSVFDDTSIWVMTFDKADTSGYKYAQVGYLRQSGDTRSYYFWEVSSSLSNYKMKKMTTYPSNGSHHDYMVACDSTYMYYKIDGVEIDKTLLSSYPFSRTAIQAIGETQTKNDQSPGSVSNPVTMGSVQYKSTSNVWTSIKCTNHPSSIGNGYGSLSTQRNNISSSGSSSWEIWDSRY